ncbi:hypothetical protein [Burkholderia territorii]|uniref:hypothetical protein n=1 Tax=Burkholderia territorii TaxID=1503055 RepID=UPI000A53D207|nr:hypothetical protein [Burkholderia territorii]
MNYGVHIKPDGAMDEREMKFAALMRKMGISKSDPTWTALEIVWDEAWAEAKGPTPLREDGFDNEDKPESWSAEEWNLGRWLSAALDDQNACAEFKEDIERWLRSLGRRTTPDRDAIIASAWKVVREALDDVVVHPCDQHDGDVKARRLPLHMHALYLALQAISDKGGA